jgi:hypothetical protein
MALTLTTIPTNFGSGGSGLSPNGSSSTPSLYTLLAEHAAGLATLDTANCQELSANGAVSIVSRTTRFAVSGTKAWTLANGAAGQRKTLFCVSQASTPVGVITPANASGFTTITFGASSANASVELEFDTSIGTPAWKVVGISGTVTIA